MARDVLIPPVAAPGNAAGSGSLQVHIALVDADGVAVPYADVANTGTIHGVGVHTITDSEYALTLSTQDELPDETYYRVQVRQGLSLYQRDVQVPAGGDLTWAEFLGLEDPVTGGMAWASRLLPDDATDGQFATYDAATSSWVATTVAPGAGVPEAPLDGEQYARQSGAWAVVAAGTGDVEEAPEDGTPYARQDSGWVAAATASQGSLAESAVQPGDVGTAAAEDVGAFDAAGSAAGAVSGHESTYDHTLIGTALQPGDVVGGTLSYTQSSHGFTDVGQPVYFTGTGYAAAAADDADTIHTGVIAAIDGDDLVIQQSGALSGITFATLTPGEFYFLADDGSIDTTPGTIHAVVLQALTSSSALILSWPASADPGSLSITTSQISDLTTTGSALATSASVLAAQQAIDLEPTVDIPALDHASIHREGGSSPLYVNLETLVDIRGDNATRQSVAVTTYANVTGTLGGAVGPLNNVVTLHSDFTYNAQNGLITYTGTASIWVLIEASCAVYSHVGTATKTFLGATNVDGVVSDGVAISGDQAGNSNAAQMRVAVMNTSSYARLLVRQTGSTSYIVDLFPSQVYIRIHRIKIG